MQVGGHTGSDVARPAQVRVRSHLAQYTLNLLTMDLLTHFSSVETFYVQDVIEYENLLSV